VAQIRSFLRGHVPIVVLCHDVRSIANEADSDNWELSAYYFLI
jgi:hypothetical protein